MCVTAVTISENLAGELTASVGLRARPELNSGASEPRSVREADVRCTARKLP
jgi:hypothetical protein